MEVSKEFLNDLATTTLIELYASPWRNGMELTKELLQNLSTATLSDLHNGITSDILSYRAFAKSVDETAFSDTITALKNVQAEISEEVTGKRGETL